MPLLLRKANVQAALEGRAQGWADDDHCVIEDERVVGRIYREAQLGELDMVSEHVTRPSAASE
jgi:hypothetical protein